MQALFTWIGYGLVTLFFAACVVAWWEHLGRERRDPEEPDWESPLPKAVKVDVEIDALAPGDARERQQALCGALSRMTEGGDRPRWTDTAPMILPGREPAVASSPAERPAPERRQRDAASAE